MKYTSHMYLYYDNYIKSSKQNPQISVSKNMEKNETSIHCQQYYKAEQMSWKTLELNPQKVYEIAIKPSNVTARYIPKRI